MRFCIDDIGDVNRGPTMHNDRKVVHLPSCIGIARFANIGITAVSMVERFLPNGKIALFDYLLPAEA